jgi:hypothetical protein
MFVILLIGVVLGVAYDARARGGNPWLWGAAAAFGLALFPILGGLIYRIPGNRFQGDGVLWSYTGAFFSDGDRCWVCPFSPGRPQAIVIRLTLCGQLRPSS